MERIVVTGANGAGKSHFATRLARARGGVPIISFDAYKLKTGWAQKPRGEVESALDAALAQPFWIAEGGPGFLALALSRAQGVVWLDPPMPLRAWRLAARPWRSFGQTRAELPAGNVDWPLEQYRFAWRSLRRGAQVRAAIAECIEAAPDVPLWRCRNARDQEAVLRDWALGDTAG